MLLYFSQARSPKELTASSCSTPDSRSEYASNRSKTLSKGSPFAGHLATYTLPTPHPNSPEQNTSPQTSLHIYYRPRKIQINEHHLEEDLTGNGGCNTSNENANSAQLSHTPPIQQSHLRSDAPSRLHLNISISPREFPCLGAFGG